LKQLTEENQGSTSKPGFALYVAIKMLACVLYAVISFAFV